MTQRRVMPLLLAPLAAGGLALALAVAATRHGPGAVHVYEQGAAAIGGLGAAVLALWARPAWTLSVGIALTAFAGHWHTMGIPLPFDRLALGCGIVSLLARERLKDRDALRSRPIDWLFAVVSIYAVCSAILAGTIGDSTARFALVDRFSVLGFVLFFVAPKAFREERDRRALLITLVALGAYLGITAVLEKSGLRSLVVPRYIADRSVGIHFGRARGPFVESAADGLALLACGTGAAIAAVTFQARRWRRVAAAVVALCALGIFLTETRAVWIAAAAGALFALLAARETRRYVLPAGAAVTAMVVVALAVIPGLGASVHARAHDQQPVWDRRNSDAAALRMIAAKPLLGFGWSRFASDSPDYYRQAPDYPLSGVRNVHNVYLGNAVELGLPVAGLWLLACLIAIGGAVLRRGPPALRPWKIGLIAVAVSYAVVGMTTPLGYVLSAMLLWTWAGIARGEDRRRTYAR